MIKMTQKLNGYIKQLPLPGVVSLLAGLASAIIIQSSNYAEVWSIYYLPSKLLGAFLGYLWVSHWSPGGYVTFHFTDKFTPTEDEKAIDHLIRKYRSNTLLLAFPILYLLIDLLVGRFHDQIGVTVSFDGIFGSLIIVFWIIATTSNGIKYLSAWWNIKRHWKKEFAR
jgi:hypothetical protein